ncbi:nitroreductase family protein, partial [Corynebacterium striatum]|uniref:nitroreductase family protein n=2 Tax=Bacteria TaxID=2 RepID=UPI001559FB89
ALDALLNRVSVPRLLEPAPTAEQREVLFAAAMRAPDHGQLRPWRFLTVEGAAREQMGTLLAEAARLQDPEAPQAVIDKAQNGPSRAPLVVVVIARLQEHFKVPKS